MILEKVQSVARQLPNARLLTVNFALGEMALQGSAHNPTGTDDWGAGRLDSRAAFANGLIGE